MPSEATKGLTGLRSSVTRVGFRSEVHLIEMNQIPHSKGKRQSGSPRSMCPKKIGCIAMPAEVGRTDARKGQSSTTYPCRTWPSGNTGDDTTHAGTAHLMWYQSLNITSRRGVG